MNAADIIGLWPSRNAFAADVGVLRNTVDKWAARGWIPGRAIPRVMIAAEARCIRLTAADFIPSGAPCSRRTAAVEIGGLAPADAPAAGDARQVLSSLSQLDPGAGVTAASGFFQES
jgi:hypothetical protein